MGMTMKTLDKIEYKGNDIIVSVIQEDPENYDGTLHWTVVLEGAFFTLAEISVHENVGIDGDLAGYYCADRELIAFAYEHARLDRSIGNGPKF